MDWVDRLELGLASFKVDVARTQLETAVLPAHSHIHRNKKGIIITNRLEGKGVRENEYFDFE